MPPSQLRGRPSVTSYLYDAEGRLERTVTASVWTAGDRALMLAYDAYEATLCPGCGYPTAIAWHPDNDGFFDAEATTCHACTALDKHAAEDASKVKPHEHLFASYTRPADRPLPPLDPSSLI